MKIAIDAMGGDFAPMETVLDPLKPYEQINTLKWCSSAMSSKFLIY